MNRLILIEYFHETSITSSSKKTFGKKLVLLDKTLNLQKTRLFKNRSNINLNQMNQGPQDKLVQSSEFTL